MVLRNFNRQKTRLLMGRKQKKNLIRGTYTKDDVVLLPTTEAFMKPLTR